MATNGTCSPLGGAVMSGSSPVTYTTGTTGAPASSDVQVLWDFDNDGDFSESVEDITSYVLSLETSMGRDYPSNLTGLSSPSKMRAVLRNDDDRFSYYNASSPLATDPFSLKLGRTLRVQTSDGVRGSASPSYVAIGTAAAADNASISPSLPSGLQSAATNVNGNADLMLMWATIRNTGTGTVDTPSGWLPVPDENGDVMRSGSCILLGRYYEDGDTAPTVTFTGGVTGATTLAQIVAFRNVNQDLGSVIAGSAITVNASAQNIAVTGFSASTSDLFVIMAWKQDDWTSVATLSGQFFTEISDTPSTAGDDAGIEIQYRDPIIASLTSTSLVVTGGASAVSKSFAFALAPAADRADPVLLSRDRFGRGNKVTMVADELDQAWTVQSNGGFSVADARAVAKNGENISHYNADIIQTVDVSAINQYVQASIPMQVQDGRVGLVVRFADTSNYTRAYYDEDSSGIKVEDVVGGSASQIGSTFTVQPWDGMTLGLGIRNQLVTVYLGGCPLDFGADLVSTRDPEGTECGLYAKWQTHSDVPPAFDNWYAWDTVRQELDGCLFTGTLQNIKTSVQAGGLKTVTIDAEGFLAAAGLTDIPAPRIVRSAGETVNTTDLSVPAGAIAGDCMARAGLSHPPHPLPALGYSDVGSHGPDDGGALEIARAVELQERGFLKETPEGGIAFEDRVWRSTYADSSLCWFTDTVGTGQFGYTFVEPEAQQSQMINRALAEVAGVAPTVVDVDNSGDYDASALDVVYTIPSTIQKGDLLLVFIASSADAAGVEWGSPPPWKDHRRLRQEEGNGMRIYSLISDGSEGGDTVTFYKGSSEGAFIAHHYLIRDWYGTDNGIDVGRISSGAVGGTDAYPVSPSWGREPTLFILFQCTIGSTGGLLWGPLTTPPPIGYDYDSLEGLVWSLANDAYEVGVESVYKLDIRDTENPRAWEDVFDDYFLLETVCVAVRGYDGPLGGPDDSGTARVEDGQIVQLDDLDSQLAHQVIRTNPDVPTLSYSQPDARDWCQAVLTEHADDRPIVTLSFVASKDSRYRDQAVRRRVSDKVTVTANGNAGLGFSRDFRIEAVHHQWSAGTTFWETTWELSPA